MQEERCWDFNNWMFPGEIRENVGLGHVLHMCFSQGV